MNVIIIVNPT